MTSQIPLRGRVWTRYASLTLAPPTSGGDVRETSELAGFQLTSVVKLRFNECANVRHSLPANYFHHQLLLQRLELLAHDDLVVVVLLYDELQAELLNQQRNCYLNQSYCKQV